MLFLFRRHQSPITIPVLPFMPHPPSVNSDASGYSSNHWKYTPPPPQKENTKPQHQTYDIGYGATKSNAAIKTSNIRIMRWLNDVDKNDSTEIQLMTYGYDPKTLDLNTLEV